MIFWGNMLEKHSSLKQNTDLRPSVNPSPGIHGNDPFNCKNGLFMKNYVNGRHIIISPITTKEYWVKCSFMFDTVPWYSSERVNVPIFIKSLFKYLKSAKLIPGVLFNVLHFFVFKTVIVSDRSYFTANNTCNHKTAKNVFLRHVITVCLYYATEVWQLTNVSS